MEQLSAMTPSERDTARAQQIARDTKPSEMTDAIQQALAEVRAETESENVKLRSLLSRMLAAMTYSPELRTFSVSEIAWMSQPYMSTSPAEWLKRELSAIVEGISKPPTSDPVGSGGVASCGCVWINTRKIACQQHRLSQPAPERREEQG